MIGAILGVSPFMSRAQAMRNMLDPENAFKGNVATEYGTFNEEHALFEFEMVTGLKIVESEFCIHPEHDWLGATPDGFVGDALIEVKCPYGLRDDPVPEFKDIEDLPHYYAQIQYQLYCTGRNSCFFYQWSRFGSRQQIVEFDPVFIKNTLPKLEAFYQEFLNGEEPEIPNHVAADEYLAAKEIFDAAKKELDKAKAALIEIADGKSVKIGPLSVYPVKREGAVSYAKVVKDHCKDVDLEPYRGKPSTSWAIK